MQKKLKFIIGFQSIGRKIFKGITKSCFSTKIDLEKIDKAKEKIRENLEKELKHSKISSRKIETHEVSKILSIFSQKSHIMKFKEFFKTSGFVHRHAPESNEIILLKIDELTKTTIEIFFQARSKPFQVDDRKKNKKKNISDDEEDNLNDENDNERKEAQDIIEEEQEELYKDHDEDEEFETCEFTVFISSGRLKETLVFECFSVESELNIKNTAVINDVNRYRSLKREEKAAFFYQGPEFEHLDNRLQKSFRDYLLGFGVNDTLTHFIESYSLFRDIQLYEDWLEKMDRFLER